MTCCNVKITNNKISLCILPMAECSGGLRAFLYFAYLLTISAFLSKQFVPLFTIWRKRARVNKNAFWDNRILKIRTSNWVVFQYLDWIKLIPSERASSEHVRHIIFFSVDYIMFCDRSIWNKWLFVKHEKLKNALKILSRSDGKESARDIQMGIISGISFEWVGEYNV